MIAGEQTGHLMSEATTKPAEESDWLGKFLTQRGRLSQGKYLLGLIA
jgi:hypothetical protein